MAYAKRFFGSHGNSMHGTSTPSENDERSRMLLEDSLELAKEQNDLGLSSLILHGLGDVSLLAGELDAAAIRYRDASLLAREIDDSGTLLYCLAGLAAVAAGRGDSATATALWRSFGQLATERRFRMNDVDRARYERFLAPQVGTDVATGQTLDEAETWTLALGGGDT